ncbi:MAG: hypothetical protein M1588_02195 [Planctomycetes bacterium]|nr:hypothetical protein [Planctomycetota bacterium]
MSQGPPFSVSEFTTWDLSFEQDVALYQRLGVTGIEVCERKISRDPAKAREQLAWLRDRGLQVTSVQPRVHALFKDSMCPELEDPRERMRRYRQSIDLFGDCFPGQDLPLVTIGGNAPAYNFRLAYETAHRLYPEPGALCGGSWGAHHVRTTASCAHECRYFRRFPGGRPAPDRCGQPAEFRLNA